MAEYKIQGIEECKDNMGKLADKVAAKLEAATAAGALLVANAAKIKAPYLSGTLRRSLHIGGFTAMTPSFEPGHPDNTGDFSDIGKGEKTDSSRTLYVGTNLDYAKKIEYGGSRQAPQGYLRPALDENQEKVEKEIAAALKDLFGG